MAETIQGTFTDPRDGKKYKYVKIGTQTWMAENLNYEAKGSICYDNDPANGEKYGRLYDRETAMKTCPPGWHLPNIKEWHTLVDFAGGNEVAGKHLKAKNGWERDCENKSGNGTDDFGFSALPGGYGDSDGSFGTAGDNSYWWNATDIDANNPGINYDCDGIGWYLSKNFLYSIRCLKD